MLDLSGVFDFFKMILDGVAQMLQTHQIIFFSFALPILAAVFLVAGLFIFDVRDEFLNYTYSHKSQDFRFLNKYRNKSLYSDRRYRFYQVNGSKEFEKMARDFQKPKLYYTPNYSKYRSVNRKPVHRYNYYKPQIKRPYRYDLDIQVD